MMKLQYCVFAPDKNKHGSPLVLGCIHHSHKKVVNCLGFSWLTKKGTLLQQLQSHSMHN